MAKTKAKVEKPKAPMAVTMRMASRISRMPKGMQAGYVERAKARLDGDHPRVNDAGVVAATES